MNSSIIDKDPRWMRAATDYELSEFLHNHLEKMDDSPRYRELKKAFDEECSRRSEEHYDSIGNGEWI